MIMCDAHTFHWLHGSLRCQRALGHDDDHGTSVKHDQVYTWKTGDGPVQYR